VLTWNRGKRKKEKLKNSVLLSCVPAFLIHFSVSRLWSLIGVLTFLLSQILHLPRPGFAAVIRSLFNQFFGGHSVKGNNCPIGLRIYDWTVPDIRRD
jgi:hypothetical protein